MFFSRKVCIFLVGGKFVGWPRKKKIVTINLGRCTVFAFWTKVGPVFGWTKMNGRIENLFIVFSTLLQFFKCFVVPEIFIILNLSKIVFPFLKSANTNSHAVYNL